MYYGATFIEAQLCRGEEVIVVGGGNSAGQAAVFLAQTAKRVHMLVRSQRAGRKHVALSDPPHRTESGHRPHGRNTEIVALEGSRSSRTRAAGATIRPAAPRPTTSDTSSS